MHIKFLGKILDKYKVEKKQTNLKPVEPVSRVEPQKRVDRDTVTFSEEGLLISSKNVAIQRVNAALDVCNRLIEKYEAIDDLEYKGGIGFSHISLVKEFKSRLETFIRLLQTRTSKDGLQDLLEQIELYFYRIDTSLPDIIDEISSIYEENKKIK